MNDRNRCAVADSAGNHCPEPAVHRVTIRQPGQLDLEVGLCEKCHQNVVAGAYGPRMTVSSRWDSVYVDEAIWPYGRMTMCHMFSPDRDALHAMADKIGVARRWFQNKPGFPHYDICKAKRAEVVRFGAVEVDRREFVAVVHRYRAQLSPMGVSCEKAG